MKAMRRAAMKAMKAHRPLAMKAMKFKKVAKAATGVMKAAAKTMKKRPSALGERGKKNPSFLSYKAGKRPAFWYGRSKVYTVIESPGIGRYRVYKVSPRDKVESGFGFSDSASAREQWELVVKLLKRLNP